MNASIENQVEQQSVARTPGFLETSEEYVCMQPFRDHPRGLVAYEQRYHLNPRKILQLYKNFLQIRKYKLYSFTVFPQLGKKRIHRT